MNHELEQKLYSSAPILYTQKDWDMQQTCMCWGIECPDEWYDLLYQLSYELETINSKNTTLGIQIQACQVKEKYYSLRFYYDIVTVDDYTDTAYLNSLRETVDTLIDEAEAKSYQEYSKWLKDNK